VERHGGVQRRVGSGGAGAGAARGTEGGGAGAANAQHMAGKAVGQHREENRGGGLEVDEGGLSCNFPKVQGLLCNAELTFKP
jgi:hypothetical protein